MNVIPFNIHNQCDGNDKYMIDCDECIHSNSECHGNGILYNICPGCNVSKLSGKI